MDLIAVATLAMFGSAFAGGLIVLAIGWVTRFEVGLVIGLLIFGGRTMWYAGRCLLEYQDFTRAGERGLWGEVVKVEDRPTSPGGRVTDEVPTIRIVAAEGSVHLIDGRVGEHVNGLNIARTSPRSPARSRARSCRDTSQPVLSSAGG